MCEYLSSWWVRTVLAAALLAPSASQSQGLKPEEIYARLLPSVMTLKVVNTKGDPFTGSGFLALGEGLAVTSWHVVFDAQEVTALFADGKKVEVIGLVDRDESRDLALVRLKSSGHPLARLASSAPRVGARAYVIGAPKGFAFSITDGLVSQIQTIDGFPQYQISCPISTGNSGGPLVNESGEVVGVASWSKIDAQNLNFAVPSEQISRLNPQKPVLTWKSLATRVRHSAATEGSASCAKTAAQTASDRELEAFRSFLRTEAGQKVTLRVEGAQNPRVFSFVVPE
jgi:serine protease Do